MKFTPESFIFPLMSAKVFISYGEEDYQVAKRLYDDLKDSGFNPWMDKENILGGRNRKLEIRQAIIESSFFLVLLSEKFLSKRGFFQKELKIALEILDEMPPDKIFIMPVRLDPCESAYEKLQDIQHTDLFPSYDEGFRQIVRALESPGDEKESRRFIDKRILEKLPGIRIEGGIHQHTQKAEGTRGSVQAVQAEQIDRVEQHFYQDTRLWIVAIIALVCLAFVLIFNKPNIEQYKISAPHRVSNISSDNLNKIVSSSYREYLKGNIRIIKNGNFAGPYRDGNIFYEKDDIHTKTDVNGNFVFYLPDNQVNDEVKLYIEYNSMRYSYIALASFMVTDDSLKKLHELNVPGNVITVLRTIKGITFRGKKAFSEAVNNVMGDNYYVLYSGLLFKNIWKFFNNETITIVENGMSIQVQYKKLNDFDTIMSKLEKSDSVKLKEYESLTVTSNQLDNLKELGKADFAVRSFYKIIGEHDLINGDIYSNLLDLGLKYKNSQSKTDYDKNNLQGKTNDKKIVDYSLKYKNLQSKTVAYGYFDKNQISKFKKEKRKISKFEEEISKFKNNEENLYLVAEEEYVYKNQVFYLEIRLRHAPSVVGVAGCAFTLNYQNDIIELEADKISSPFLDTEKKVQYGLGAYEANFSIPGKILFASAFIDSSPINMGGGRLGNHFSLFRIYFRVKKEAPFGIIKFELQETLLNNPDAGWNGEPVPVLVGAYPLGTKEFHDLQKAFPIILNSFKKKPSTMIVIAPESNQKKGIGNLSRMNTVVRVQSVVEGSQAQALNLKKGDIIVSYNGTEISRTERLIELIRRAFPEKSVKMAVFRDGKLMQFELKGGRIGVQIKTAVISKKEYELMQKQLAK
ncbi:MAG: TIR domain-containing protein [Desulfobacterales bacterium]|nr:TIR domain-containing protein [Desulfobacterales bacterium]